MNLKISKKYQIVITINFIVITNQKFTTIGFCSQTLFHQYYFINMYFLFKSFTFLCNYLLYNFACFFQAARRSLQNSCKITQQYPWINSKLMTYAKAVYFILLFLIATVIIIFIFIVNALIFFI